MHASYHGNILAAATAGATVDPFYFNPDMVKFDPSGCYAGQAGYDPSSSAQHHGYGRFAPFDVVRAPASKQAPTGYGGGGTGGGGGALGPCYPLGGHDTSSYLTTNGTTPSQQSLLQTGHFMDQGLASCKQVTQGMGTEGGGGGGGVGIISSYGTRNFASMTAPPQNLPIYPWMRSIAGGKNSLRLLLL